MQLPSMHLKGLLCLLLLLTEAAGMFSKRPLPERDRLEPSKRLKANLQALFLQGDVSGARAHTLFEDASHLEGGGDFKKLAKAGNKGKYKGNLHRDLLSKLAKAQRGWPALYHVQLPLWCPKKQQMVQQWVPMLPPHQLIKSLLSINSSQDLLVTARLAATARAHLERCKQALGCTQVVPLALWGNGVPCNWDRSESLEMMCLSLPGLANKGSQLHIPLVGISKKFFVKEET